MDLPELDNEVSSMVRAEATRARVQRLQAERNSLQTKADRHSMARLELRRAEGPPAEELAEVDAELAELWTKIDAMNEELTALVCQVHELFHPTWGQLLKAGQQNSKWAQQVQTYACLYTSHVTNLAFISPETRFRVYSDMMPHERKAFEASNPLLATAVGEDDDGYEVDI